jgi:hypothetical protein
VNCELGPRKVTEAQVPAPLLSAHLPQFPCQRIENQSPQLESMSWSAKCLQYRMCCVGTQDGVCGCQVTLALMTSGNLCSPRKSGDTHVP